MINGVDLKDIIFEWNDEKNNILKNDRNVCFEDIITCVNSDKVYDITENKSGNFDGQFCLVVDINNYIYLVPFIFNKNKIFLKTIYPSRKYNKIYNNK